jgi:BirA family biotin operon repressor/biotin-[acetyl-CoA-carboxylase] ligase
MRDERFPTQVLNPFPGAGIVYHRETESTMIDARELLLEGSPHGTVVVSDYQRAGQGRKSDRRWAAPSGQALLCTVLLRHSVPLTALSLRVGLAVAKAITERTGLQPAVKWPNDILLNGRKVCGVLCRQGATWALVGVGLNVNQESFPDEHAGAISLRIALGSQIARGPLLESLLRHVKEEAQSDAPIDRRLQPLLYGLGREVTLRQDDGGTVVGVLRGLTDRGALRIETTEGERELYAGELVVSRG